MGSSHGEVSSGCASGNYRKHGQFCPLTIPINFTQTRRPGRDGFRHSLWNITQVMLRQARRVCDGSFLTAAMWEIEHGPAQYADSQPKISHTPEIHPIIQEPGRWSFRLLITPHPQTSHQTTTDLAEIGSHSKKRGEQPFWSLILPVSVWLYQIVSTF